MNDTQIDSPSLFFGLSQIDFEIPHLSLQPSTFEASYFNPARTFGDYDMPPVQDDFISVLSATTFPLAEPARPPPQLTWTYDYLPIPAGSVQSTVMPPRTNKVVNRRKAKTVNKCIARKFKKGVDDCKECCICLEPYVKGNTLCILPCKHQLHKKCIDQWFKRTQVCPLCRCPPQ